MIAPTKADLIDALRFYADPKTHEARDEDGTAVWPILADQGQRARAVLGIPEPPTFEQQLAAIGQGEEAAV